MAVCQICGKGQAEWQCQTCRRLIDADCAKPTSKGVFCIEHAPATTFQQTPSDSGTGESGTAKALKQGFVMLLFLTIGLGALVVVGQYFISKQATAIPGAVSFVEILKTAGNTIIYGLTGLTILLGLAWLAVRKK